MAVALLSTGSAVVAERAEPLIVTELPDPSLVPLSGAQQSSERSLAEARHRLSLTIAEAIQADQRSIEEACRSRPANAAAASHYDWQANCLYRRR